MQCERLLAALDPPVLTGRTLPKNSAADTPDGVVTISPSLAPPAFSCESTCCTSNAKCLGELSTSCPLATDTLLNSRNQTILPTATRHKDDPPPTHRSIQDANYHNQIVKERTGASLTSLSSTCLSWQTAKAIHLNRQGPNSFCFNTPCLTCLQSNPASGYSGLRFFTARLTSTPSHRSPTPLFRKTGDKKVMIPLARRTVNRSPFKSQGTGIPLARLGLYRPTGGLQAPESFIRDSMRSVHPRRQKSGPLPQKPADFFAAKSS